MSNIQGLLDALGDRPNDFKEGRYTLRDTATNAEYWISNGFWFYGMNSPAHYRFSFIDKIRFSRALNKWRAGYIKRLNILASTEQ